MAFTEFYMDSGGSNLNAGSVVNAAASVTSTNGNWSTVTNIFTPAGGGTPFSGVSAGDWVSLYLDAATITTFIAKVATVNSGGATITLDATARLGTVPVTGATGRTVKVGGSWVSFAIFTSSVFSAGTAGTPMRVNVKQATYANTTTNRTTGAAGTSTNPIWFRGYNTTPGDCDTDYTLTHPSITFTTGHLTLSNNFWVWSSIDVLVTGASGNAALDCLGNSIVVRRCNIEHQQANTAATALNLDTGAGFRVFECYIKATTTATSCVRANRISIVAGCFIDGGGSGINHTTDNACIFYNNVITALSFGVNSVSTGQVFIIANSIYNVTSDGIRLSGVIATNNGLIAGNIISTTNGNAINFSNASTGGSAVLYNAFYAITGNNINNMTDFPAFANQSLGADPFVNAASDDFTLATGSAALSNGLPTLFQAQSFTSYLDIGAVIHPVGSSGGGGIRIAGHGGLAS